MTHAAGQTPLPRGAHRILYVSDPSTIARTMLPDPCGEQDLRRWVDMLADAGVDLFDQEVFSQGWTAYWKSERFEYDRRIQHRRFRPLIEAGKQPIEILIDQSHRRGMKFIAGLRVNDGHAYEAKEQGVGIASFIEYNPQWQLKERPQGDAPKMSVPLDFSFAEVREFTRGAVAELADRFDIDGIELCFRDDAYFPQGRGRELAGRMTDLIRGINKMLIERSASSGRRLMLGARVPPTLAECAELGLDLANWIRDGAIDYVSPQDKMYSDFNVPFGEWAELTRASDCMLYPGMLPWTSHRARYRLKKNPLTQANCRALAHSMYGAGADGVSIYNHHVVLWHPPFYPQSMQVFHQLRDPERIAFGERHYIFEPTWAGFTGFGIDGKSPTGAIKAQQLVLSRNSSHSQGGFRFNLYEDLARARGATLAFRGFGLTHRDELDVSLNGVPIPDDMIRRTWPSRTRNGAPAFDRRQGELAIPCLPEGGRIDARESQDKPSPEFSTRFFPLRAKMLRQGENRLSVTLIHGDPNVAHLKINIDELEIWVQPA